jgi:hypothetical protein
LKLRVNGIVISCSLPHLAGGASNEIRSRMAGRRGAHELVLEVDLDGDDVILTIYDLPPAGY